MNYVASTFAHLVHMNLRVAMLTYSTRPRGGVVHALKLAERLHSLGVEISLYSLARADDPTASQGFFREVSVPFSIFTYDWHPDMIQRLERMIDAYSSNLPRNCHLYHTQDCVGGTALAKMKERGLISAPIFRTIHHIDDFAEPTLFEFEKRAVAHADHRFVVSKYWQAALRKDFGFESLVVYNGIDMSDFSRLPAKTSVAPTVLFVGGLEPRKGLEYLLLAMKDVIDTIPETRLIAVAKTGFRGTDEWTRFRQLADRLDISENMVFRESVPQRELLQFYSNCDLVVLPSKAEGWGLSLMEAMACCKPVVATRVGGIPELVRDGVDGILVVPGDTKALAEAIVLLLGEPSMRRKMGEAGNRRVSGFSWDDTARTVLSAYKNALHLA